MSRLATVNPDQLFATPQKRVGWGQLLRGLVLRFHTSQTQMVGGYLAESKWLRYETPKKLPVWTPGCATKAAFGPRSESHLM
jgi:hypothetical protein